MKTENINLLESILKSKHVRFAKKETELNQMVFFMCKKISLSSSSTGVKGMFFSGRFSIGDLSSIAFSRVELTKSFFIFQFVTTKKRNRLNVSNAWTVLSYLQVGSLKTTYCDISSGDINRMLNKWSLIKVFKITILEDLFTLIRHWTFVNQPFGNFSSA